jgi:hypothetical protein
MVDGIAQPNLPDRPLVGGEIGRIDRRRHRQRTTRAGWREMAARWLAAQPARQPMRKLQADRAVAEMPPSWVNSSPSGVSELNADIVGKPE